MSSPLPSHPMPAPAYGTSLVDRINLSMHLRRYLKLILRRWLILFTCTVAGLGVSLYKVHNTLSLFSAQAELEITRKVQVSAGGAVVLDPMDSFYPDQLRLMGSGALRARVLSMIRNSPTPKLEPPNTSCVPLRGQGSSFQLAVTSPDLDYAKLYASNWAQAFLDYKKEQVQKILEAKKATYLTDVFRQEKSLEKSRAETEKFRKEHQIGSASDTYKAAQQQLDQLKGELGRVQTQRRLLEQTSKEDLASGALGEKRSESGSRGGGANAGGPQSGSSDPLSKFLEDNNYVPLRAQLNDKTLQYNTLTNTLKARHPEMVRLSREIEQLNQKIAFQLQTIEDKRRATLQSLGLTEEGLFQRIKELTTQVQDLRGVQDEFDRLKQEEGRIEQALLSLKNTLQQIDLSTPDEGQFSVVGEVATAAVNPQKSKTILQGVSVGFLVGLALIYFLQRLDDRLELAEDIEAELEQPVLGQVPQVDMRSVKEGYLLITKLQRHNMFAEAIRGVRSAIMLGAYQGRKQVLLVSSAVPGDGKTTFTVNFAATLAVAGNRVLLVDADLRRGNVHNYFQLTPAPGLTEVLTGETHWSEVARETEIKTLRVISSGKLPAHPGELLVSPVMQQLLEEARQEFDYVVLDCPPLAAIDDTFSLVGLMDGLIFVVRAGQTSMRFAKTALAAVRQRGANILGIVLNGITADNPYYYYNYYYHSYYSHQPQTETTALGQTHTATKMASRKSRRYTEKTILAEAMAMSGQAASTQALEKQARAKAELFKSRRAVKTGALPAGANAAPHLPGNAPADDPASPSPSLRNPG